MQKYTFLFIFLRHTKSRVASSPTSMHFSFIEQRLLSVKQSFSSSASKKEKQISQGSCEKKVQLMKISDVANTLYPIGGRTKYMNGFSVFLCLCMSSQKVCDTFLLNLFSLLSASFNPFFPSITGNIALSKFEAGIVL